MSACRETWGAPHMVPFGEVRVLALEVLEGVEVPRGWVAGLGAGDVEADHALVAVLHRQLCDLPGARGVPHRRQQLSYDDPASGLPHALVEALLHRPHDL